MAAVSRRPPPEHRGRSLNRGLRPAGAPGAGQHQVGEARRRDQRQDQRRRPHLVEGRARRRQRGPRPGDVDRLEGEPGDRGDVDRRPRRPRLKPPGRPPLAAQPGDQCGERDQQEGDVDRRRAEGDQAADGGRLEAEQEAGAADDGGRDDAADRRRPAVDPGEEARAGQRCRRAPSSRPSARSPPGRRRRRRRRR